MIHMISLAVKYAFSVSSVFCLDRDVSLQLVVMQVCRGSLARGQGQRTLTDTVTAGPQLTYDLGEVMPSDRQ